MGKTMFLCLSENPTEDKKTFHPRRKTIFHALVFFSYLCTFEKSGIQILQLSWLIQSTFLLRVVLFLR